MAVKRQMQRGKPLRAKPRSKGNRSELEVIEILKAHGYPAYRNWQSGGQGGNDVLGLPGFGVEVKNQQRLNIWAAIAQCKDAASPTDIAAVVFRRNNHEWMAAIPFEDLLGLIEASQPRSG